MKTLLLMGLLAAEIVQPVRSRAAEPLVIDVTRFGAQPDSGQNAAPVVKLPWRK